MEKTKELIEKVENAICQEFFKGAESIDTKEMGEAIDMYKDLHMAHYYASITKAMEEGAEYGTDYDYMGRKGYSEPYRASKKNPKYPDDFYNQRDMDYPHKMYYTEPKTGKTMQKDSREGMAGEMRKTYVESKQIHGADSDEMQPLEDFLNTLEHDMMELYPNMTMAEKQMTKNKLQTMISKVI